VKTLLVELDPQVRDGRLDCAADLARAFGSHIVGVQATPVEAFVSFDPFGGAYAMPAVLEAVTSREQEIRSAFEEEMAKEGLSWEYRHGHGAPAQVMAEASRLADLIVMAKPGSDGTGSERLSHVGGVVLSSSAPVLALPPETRTFDPFGRALVAWNGSPEASNAVRMALPLLSLASEVTLLTAEEPEGKWDLPATGPAEYLSRHGIHAVIDTVTVTDADIPYSLLVDVADRKPSYLVMGAYGRSRAREWLLGGVTRRMIKDLPAPLLLAH
jgi:nucleotide-binding universal stress UspA family protein